MHLKFQKGLGLSIFLGLLILHAASSEADKKAEIGEKLFEMLKTNGRELLKIHINELKILCERLLNEGKPNDKQVEQLKADITTFDKFIKDIDQMSVTEIIDASKQIIGEKLVGYLRLHSSDHQRLYGAERELITEIVSDSAKKSEEAANNFAMKIYHTWTELYETLSEDDLKKHAEYERINELMQGVERTKGRGAVFKDAIKLCIQFFDYKDWKALLELGDD